MKLGKHTLLSLVSVLVTASMLLTAMPARANACAGTVGAEPLPPPVVQVTPAPGEEQPLDAPLQVTFDQPMQPASVQAAFTIEPAVEGDFTWPTPRVMQFKPQPPWSGPRGTLSPSSGRPEPGRPGAGTRSISGSTPSVSWR